MHKVARGIAIAVGIILSAYVFVFLWKWFIVPLGLKEISVFHGMGIRQIVYFLTGNIDTEEEDERTKDKKAIRGFISPIIFFLFGWLWHYLM